MAKKKKVSKRKRKPAKKTGDSVRRPKIKIIGIGGGGGSIVSEIASRVRKVNFVIANTDTQSLKRSSKKAKKFHFGMELTHGLGTGMDVEVASAAAENSKEKIKKMMEGQDLCILVASLGGGTGSGAGPLFAKISKSLGNLTYGIFTLPFEFEGRKKTEIAREALKKIKPNVNAYTVFPNERIFQIIDKNNPLSEALSAINEKLGNDLEGLIEMIYLPALINIDFADLKTIFKGKGRLAYLNAVDIEGPEKEEVVKKIISSPLYPYTIRGAKSILYNISGSKDLQLDQVAHLSQIINEAVNRKAKIIFGVSQSSKLKSSIRLTLLALGCSTKGLLFLGKEGEKSVPVKKEKAAPAKKKKAAPAKKKKTPKPPKLKKTAAEKKKSIKEMEEGLKRKKRKSGVQVKKEEEKAEKELLEREEVWEIPAILRKKDKNS